jgi:predicted butyrate kinase (DUF1464 family)
MNGGRRAVGIDPGTKSFDVCGLEGDRLFLDRTIPTADLSANPQVLVDLLRAAGPLDMVIGPSGYGLPWIAARDLGPRHVNALLLSEERDSGRAAVIGGMRRMLGLLKESGLPVYFAPSVIHLPTVPLQRKINRIDMGTADKLCAVALGIRDQSIRLNLDYEAASFIYIELGGAFTAVIAVENGKVVDGFGGTSGPMGYLALGSMDGELAYQLGSFHKEVLCSGGMAHIAGHPQTPPEELMARVRTDARCGLALDAFLESLVKCVCAEMSIVRSPREILISGRLCRVQEFTREVIQRLSHLAPVCKVEGFARIAKEAAQGAALLAEGMAGGIYERLIDVMQLRDAGGGCLDNLWVDGAESLRRKYLD